MEFVARKQSYKVLQGWGDGQVRDLFAIYSFPLLFASDVSSEQLKIPEKPQAWTWIVGELVSQFGLLEFWDDSSVLGREASPLPFNCMEKDGEKPSK